MHSRQPAARSTPLDPWASGCSVALVIPPCEVGLFVCAQREGRAQCLYWCMSSVVGARHRPLVCCACERERDPNVLVLVRLGRPSASTEHRAGHYLQVLACYNPCYNHFATQGCYNLHAIYKIYIAYRCYKPCNKNGCNKDCNEAKLFRVHVKHRAHVQRPILHSDTCTPCITNGTTGYLGAPRHATPATPVRKLKLIPSSLHHFAF